MHPRPAGLACYRRVVLPGSKRVIATAAPYGLVGLGLSSQTGTSGGIALVGLVFVLIAVVGITAATRRSARFAVGAAVLSVIPPIGLLALIPLALLRIGDGSSADARSMSASLGVLLPGILIGVMIAGIATLIMVSGAIAMRRATRPGATLHSGSLR